MKNVQQFLAHVAYNLRVDVVRMTTQAGSGHVTSALSAADIVAVLFFYAMRFDPKNHDNPNNDRFVLSKGHAAPIFYAVYKQLGVLSDAQLMTYRHFDSELEGHPTLRFSRTEAATGSLGMGLSYGVGMGLAGKMDKRDYATYVLLGDSEVSEGSVWEAAELGAYNKLDNVIGIVDVNRLGQTGQTMHGRQYDRYVEKFSAFGWHTIECDGHDIGDLIRALDEAKSIPYKPAMIIAKTIKGYGVERVADKNGFHGKAFKAESEPEILDELKNRFADAAAYEPEQWKPNAPPPAEPISVPKKITLPMPMYERGDQLPTRKAYGQALAALGDAYDHVVSLDGEVKNSTFAQTFEEKHPGRFIQCFIAEQNMVSMAVGLQTRRWLPCVSTFAAFFSRAYDQLRMAAVSQCPLRLAGSHAGVSIGQDGPSQMGLEDIALMRALPDSTVLYPSDAVSTYKLLECMANNHKGMSYLRTTRMETPIIYQNEEVFEIGGCKIVRQSDQDRVCIVAAGVTLHEALKAYELLKEKGKHVAVVDLYSIKPLDFETLERMGIKSQNRIITVEDHYLEGGLGQAVSYALRNTGIRVDCLAVTKLPRSGMPDELLAWEGIDAAAIVKAVG